MDRALYIWSCARGPCRGKDGRYVVGCPCSVACNTVMLTFGNSVRAWRGLRRNEAYAAKLEKRLARKRDRMKEQGKIENEIALNSNPFSVRSVFCALVYR